METKNCITCGKEFPKPYSYSQKSWVKMKYCSFACRRTGAWVDCKICGKKFSVIFVRKDKAKYCSYECTYKARIGKPNYSNPCKGQFKTTNCENCGKEVKIGLTRYNRTKHHFCSNKCAGLLMKQRTGSNHPRWTYGKYSEDKRLREQPAYQEWRKLVYKRDGWTCQDCGKKVRDIVAHHVFSFSEFPSLRYETDNGVTLCRPCHKIRHSEIGIKTRFQKQTMLQSIKL